MSCHGWSWRWARYFIMISIDIWSYDHKIPSCAMFSQWNRNINLTKFSSLTTPEVGKWQRQKFRLIDWIIYCVVNISVYGQFISIELWTWDIGTKTRWPPFLQTTLSCAFSWMKAFEFQTKFHWNVFFYVVIDNKPSLVQIMCCRRKSDNPLSEPMMVYIPDAYIRHSAPMR